MCIKEDFGNGVGFNVMRALVRLFVCSAVGWMDPSGETDAALAAVYLFSAPHLTFAPADLPGLLAGLIQCLPIRPVVGPLLVRPLAR